MALLQQLSNSHFFCFCLLNVHGIRKTIPRAKKLEIMGKTLSDKNEPSYEK